MGKSWLTAVKRAFRSPTKDTHKKSKTRDDTADQEHQDLDKRDRRRWIFRKPANQETVVSTQMKVKPSSTADQQAVAVVAVAAATDQNRAVAVAVATAQATMEAARLNNNRGIGRDRKQQHYAAIVIQTAFRGYLARRALRALKGLVKLQALVRGHNVRKQAKMTLRCMQALVRVQSRVLDQRTRFSHEGSSSRKSTFSDTNSLWESRYLHHDISDRKSMSREGSSITSDWDERPHTVEEVKAMLQRRKEAASMKRDKINLSQAFSQQIRRNSGTSSIVNEEDDLEERPKRMDRWMTTKPWENRGRASTDQRDPIKTLEIDTSVQPYSYLGPNNYRRSHPNYQYNPQSHQPPRNSIASPRHRTSQNASIQHSPATPSPAKSRPIQVRSASPRYSKEDRSYQTSQTPNLRLNNHNYRRNISLSSRGGTSNYSGANMPSYMAATESAKARIRSQSAPRQRASTPERERDRVGSARKRLSYPAPAPHDPSCYNVGMGYGHRNSLRSPSFKSVSGSHFGLEQHSNYSSCCTDSFAGEISPSSTSDLRRWLR